MSLAIVREEALPSSANAFALIGQLREDIQRGDQPGKGPGMFGFNQLVDYDGDTLGAYLVDGAIDPTITPFNCRFDGTTNDSTEFQRCINEAAARGRPVRCPPGRTLLQSIEWPSNLTLLGSGIDSTFIECIAGSDDLFHIKDPASTDPANNTKNIRFSGFTIDGKGSDLGFQEDLHLLVIKGASDVDISGNKFMDWRGDAIYDGTGNEHGTLPAQVRHNQRIRIRGNIFDGVTKNNRNAVSVIDSSGFEIYFNKFTRCSKSNMPGCIDVEPDSGGGSSGTTYGTASIIQKGLIAYNDFYDNAGASVIAFNFPVNPSAMTSPPHDLLVVGNVIDGGATAYTVGISCSSTEVVSDSSARLNLRILYNTIRNVSSPFYFVGVRGIECAGNTWADTRYSAQIGASNGTLACFDVSIRDTFQRVAKDIATGGNALFAYAFTRLDLSGSKFFECGKADNTYNANIVFESSGVKSDPVIEDCWFRSDAANAVCWDVRYDGTGLVAGLNRHRRNRLINITNAPVNFRHDFMETQDGVVPSYNNNWADTGGDRAGATYYKDSANRVWLGGYISRTSGTYTPNETALSFLPKFRGGGTNKRRGFNVPCGNAGAMAYLELNPANGDLQVVYMPSNTFLCLDGINWQAMQ